MTRVKNKLQAIFLFILIFHFYIFAQYPLVNQLDPELYIVKAMYYVQTMDISMMNKCVKVWRTLFIIYVCGILIILYEQQWFRPTHTHINGDRDDILQILGLKGLERGSLLLDLRGRVCF